MSYSNTRDSSDEDEDVPLAHILLRHSHKTDKTPKKGHGSKNRDKLDTTSNHLPKVPSTSVESTIMHPFEDLASEVSKTMSELLDLVEVSVCEIVGVDCESVCMDEDNNVLDDTLALNVTGLIEGESNDIEISEILEITEVLQDQNITNSPTLSNGETPCQFMSIANASVLSSESGSMCSTPLQTSESRKRVRKPETWEKTKKKRAVNKGEPFISKDGKITKGREVRPGCNDKCRKKCQTVFTPNDRKEIFSRFWSLENLSQKRQFISNNVSSQQKTMTKLEDSRRKRTLSWSLPLPSKDEKISVCKTFFLHTLDISETMVFTAVTKTRDGIAHKETRGGAFREATEEKEHVRKHIESFPVVDSHFCRKSTKRQYLGSHLNISLMHRLYVVKRNAEGGKPLSLKTYSEVFSTEYNLGFHRPIKDQCDLCTKYLNTTEDSKETIKEEYTQHLTDHKLVSEMKSSSKERSKASIDFEAYAFDLEQVLVTPKMMASSSYYKRKLSTYNLSWYELGSGRVVCNIWHEGLAGRGSNEIASCIFKLLEDASKRDVKYVDLFSDSCGGQNRNRFFVTMLWFAINRLSIQEVVHTFFVRGHSKNENDSVHSTVERAAQKIEIYTSGQWAAVVRGAKHKEPHYKVEELDTSDFHDFKKVAALLANFDLDSEKNKVNWMGIRKILLTKNSPFSFFYSETPSGEYTEVNLLQRVRKMTKVDPNDIQLVPVNDGKRTGIDKDKKRDLMTLCEQQLIPKVHHSFFEQLKTKL